MTKVSIIIPVYNVEKYLEKALDSACNQTLKDIEIICIDDYSTDNSATILKKYAEKDSRIKLIFLKESCGQGNARNIGLKNVSSEYIMFLDSDDWLEENACENAYYQIKNNNNDIVTFNYFIYFEKNNIRKIKNTISVYRNLLNNKEIKINQLKYFNIYGGCTWHHIFNTDFITRNQIIFGDGHYGEDSIFFLKALLSSNSISLINKPLYNYRKRGNKSSCMDSSKYCFEGIMSKKDCYKLIKNFDNKNLYNMGLIYCINSILYLFKRNYLKIKNISTKKTFYKEIQQVLKLIYNENNFDEILKTKIRYREFIRIIESDYNKYHLLTNIDRIFSIYKEFDKYKISILGIKITL